MKKERNYYPLGLAIFGAALVTGLAFMIKIAVQNPVEMDSSHMMPYREFDKRYNEIAELERKFDQNFVVSTVKPIFAKDAPAVLELNVSDKNGADANAKIIALVTRPDTSKYDIKIESFEKNGTTYISKPFSVGLEGRWKVMYKLEVNGTQKFVELESFAAKAK